MAMKNSIIYAKETDGHALPNILASHDPEGFIHYYLGSDDSDIRIKADGKRFELMIDYVPTKRFE